MVLSDKYARHANVSTEDYRFTERGPPVALRCASSDARTQVAVPSRIDLA